MNARHLEERRETLLGEEFVYYVTVYDEPIPAPSAAVVPTPEAARRRDCTAPSPLQTPTRPARTVRPTKAQYVNSFAESGPLPYRVVMRVNHLNTWSRARRNDPCLAGNRMPRRLRKALARFERGDFATRYYDPATPARVERHFRDTQQRSYLSKMAV